MKSYDNNGKLVSEINQIRTSDNKSITMTTLYNTSNGRPVNQNVSVTDYSNGKITVTNIVNGKLLP